MTDSHIETDVLIIGGGIAGPALACVLRESALKVMLVEKSDAPLDTARGDHLQPITCEILERWGVLDDLFRNGAEKRCNSIWQTPDGEQLMNSAIGELDIPHPYFAFLNHEKISEIFLSAAAHSPHFEMIRPIRNWWLEESLDRNAHVRIGLNDGSERRVIARLLAGADGRASRTRKLMEIGTETYHYQNPIGVLFADCAESDPPRNLRVFVNDSRMVSVIPRTGGGCKIGIPMSPNEVSEWRQADSETLERRLSSMIPALHIKNVRFGDVYPPIYLQTERWVQENVVLIGDACHAMHPARSQGMNIAIRCIDTLATQLTKGTSPLHPDFVRRTLIDYENEVRPQIDPVLRDNHRRGLEMDGMEDDGYAKLVESMRRLQSDAQALHRYTMNAAGYGSSNTHGK